MQLLGSVICVTSDFYGFAIKGSLLSTLDSLLFCIFIIQLKFRFFKMGYSIRIGDKYRTKCG